MSIYGSLHIHIHPSIVVVVYYLYKAIHRVVSSTDKQERKEKKRETAKRKDKTLLYAISKTTQNLLLIFMLKDIPL